MKKFFLFIFLSVFCVNAFNAQVTWNLSDDGILTISGTGDMYSKPWSYQQYNIKKIIIENGVESICSNAFSDCSNLISVTISNSVTSIGNSAFYYCTALTSVKIPNNVLSIGRSAFQGCKDLTSVTIPKSVTRIDENAFSGCLNFTNLVYNAKNAMMYSDCFPTSIKIVTIGNEVEVIPQNFLVNSNISSITIPNSVTSISYSAFRGCLGLTSVIVEKGNKTYDSRNNCNAIIETESNTLVYGFKKSVIPNSVTSIGNSAFSDCSSLTSIVIPNSVTSIGNSAFQNCSSLTSVTIPNSVTSIGESTFCDCYNLASITIPNSVTSIGGSAFYGCYNLKKITIGRSIESIGSSTFGNCYNIQSVIINNLEPPTCVSSTFICSTDYVRDKYDVYTYATIHVPMGSKEAYSSAHEWRYFNKIKEDMELDGKVYYAKLAVKQGTTGYTEQPVKADETYTIYIGALNNSKINAVTFNGEDVTDQVNDGYYTTPEIKAKSILSISYEDIITTNVKEISNPELKVTGNNGEINISGIVSPTDVEVYTTDGKLVESKGSVYGDTSIQVKENELYIVKVGKRAIKIAM